MCAHEEHESRLYLKVPSELAILIWGVLAGAPGGVGGDESAMLTLDRLWSIRQGSFVGGTGRDAWSNVGCFSFVSLQGEVQSCDRVFQSISWSALSGNHL